MFYVSVSDYIIEQVHNPSANKDGYSTVPSRMGWLAWISTLASHLCGASVGREGTGLQIGASLSNSVTRFYAFMLRTSRRRMGRGNIRLMTVGAIAAGFSGVFGTPYAAVVFALEVLSIGALATDAVVPCILASFSANIVSERVMKEWDFGYTKYSGKYGPFDLRADTLMKLVAAALLFGAAAWMFSEGIHVVQWMFKLAYRHPKLHVLEPYEQLLTPFVGGVLVILLTYIFQTSDYLGIGTLRPEGNDTQVVLQSCFGLPGNNHCMDWSFLAKILFTCVSLGAGYKGGEVTCLFFVGASAGYTAAHWLGASGEEQLFASTGYVAVFAAAAHTPLASTLMGVELFGSEYLAYFALGCHIAALVSGKASIYAAQQKSQWSLLQDMQTAQMKAGQGNQEL
jgi:H+/Cl- antiporter ClcA